MILPLRKTINDPVGTAGIVRSSVAAIGFWSALVNGMSEKDAHDEYLYFCRNDLHAIRKENWKLMLRGQQFMSGYVKDRGTDQAEPYDLRADIGEADNVAQDRSATVAKLLQFASAFEWPERVFEPAIK